MSIFCCIYFMSGSEFKENKIKKKNTYDIELYIPFKNIIWNNKINSKFSPYKKGGSTSII